LAVNKIVAHHNIAWFDVPMDNPLRMNVIEGSGNLQNKIDLAIHIYGRIIYQLLQILTVKVLGHNVKPIITCQKIDKRKNIGMLQGLQQLSLFLES